MGVHSVSQHQKNVETNSVDNKRVSPGYSEQSSIKEETDEQLVYRLTEEKLAKELAEQNFSEVQVEKFVVAESENKTAKIESTESVERIAQSSERFAAEISGFQSFVKLHKDEVLFLDEHNIPVGEPRKFEDFVDKKKKSDGTVMEQYLYTPGVLNEAGFPPEGIAGEWTRYVQKQVQEQYPSREIAQRVNVIADFRAAYAEQDEPELVAAIRSGEVSSYDEIVGYFAEKPVRGAEHLNRMEYAQQEIKFRSQEEAGRPAVPESIQSEFKRILPGLFAHESKFNAGLSSSTGAKGLAQIMPETWKEYRGDSEVSLGLTDQLEVAGKLISDNYHYITHYAEKELPVLCQQFNSVEEFEKDLIVPLMVTAYNVGGPAIGLLVREFVAQTPQEELATGRDLFLQFRDFAQSSEKGKEFYYGEEAGKYVSGVYGNVAMLEEKYGGQEDKSDYRVAQN